jgi:hypothetical protein
MGKDLALLVEYLIDSLGKKLKFQGRERPSLFKHTAAGKYSRPGDIDEPFMMSF